MVSTFFLSFSMVFVWSEAPKTSIFPKFVEMLVSRASDRAKTIENPPILAAENIIKLKPVQGRWFTMFLTWCITLLTFLDRFRNRPHFPRCSLFGGFHRFWRLGDPRFSGFSEKRPTSRGCNF